MAAGKSDVLVKLVLVFFISLLSFSIGTFVGKNYSDNQHRRAALEPQDQSRSVASANDHGSPTGNEGAMSDEEISKLAEEFADEEGATTQSSTAHEDAHAASAHGEGHGDAHAAPATKHETPAAASDKAAHAPAVSQHAAPAAHGASEHAAVSAPAKNIVAGKAPTESIAKQAHQESRVPSSIPKDVAQYSVGKFTVQIASFPTENDAKARAEDLKSRGYSAFYVPANVKGKTWYRVSVGLFATEEEAKTHRQDIIQKAKIENAIIQKITN